MDFQLICIAATADIRNLDATRIRSIRAQARRIRASRSPIPVTAAVRSRNGRNSGQWGAADCSTASGGAFVNSVDQEGRLFNLVWGYNMACERSVEGLNGGSCMRGRVWRLMRLLHLPLVLEGKDGCG